MRKYLAEQGAYKGYAEWLQSAAALRAEFRDLGLPIPPPLARAIDDDPAMPWKAPTQEGGEERG